MIRIAVDAMGGDAAPGAIVGGAVKAVLAPDAPEIALCGPEPDVTACLEQAAAELPVEERETVLSRIGVKHAPDVVEMHESPIEALRRKPQNSVSVGLELMREGRAQAIVTAGHTGAAVAAATLALKLLPGIRRPGIAVTIQSGRGSCTIIDVGANIKCKPIHLLHYGVMASSYHRLVHGVSAPRVGLLNIGEEDRKGTDLVKETLSLFRKSPLNFVGNIEGQDVFLGKCDVVVCEGFVGNVLLKVSEGFAEWILQFLSSEAGASDRSPDERRILAATCRKFASLLDYNEHGGALLLGIDGNCVICHGRSGPRAIANAIRLAARFVQLEVNNRIVAGLESLAAPA